MRGKNKQNFDDTIKRALREYAEALIVAILIAVFLRVFIVSAYKIPTSSMSPNLKVGDFIFVNKIIFGFEWPIFTGKKFSFRSPERGDVVVFKCPQEKSVSCVKRVVGLPGDKIQIIKKNLVVNDEIARYKKGKFQSIEEQEVGNALLIESVQGKQRAIIITSEPESESFGPIIVPPEHFFVLGDSRDTSDDSRFWGAIPYSSLQGKVMFVWMSLDWSKTWQNKGWPRVRWERLFTWVN